VAHPKNQVKLQSEHREHAQVALTRTAWPNNKIVVALIMLYYNVEASLTVLNIVVPPLVVAPPIVTLYPLTVTHHSSMSPAMRLSRMGSMFFTIPSLA